jgi:hypothetical protein
VTSPTVATRARGGRCVCCNQLAALWLCETCSLSSAYYSARFNDDVRPTSPTMVGRRNLYPSPATIECVAVELPPLSTTERLHSARAQVEGHDWSTQEHALSYLKALVAGVGGFETLSARVDAVARPRASERARLENLNTVQPLDPRRWCDECIAARTHRNGCALIEIDGRFVGGYPNDGLTREGRKKFGKLATAAPHWLPSHHRQHERAVRRRWNAFSIMWTKIGLEIIARYFRGEKPPKDGRSFIVP